MIINIVGHRGFGASDGPFHVARDEKAGTKRPVEGTIVSLRQALEAGADGVEMDAIETADGLVVGTHADEVRHHILVPFEPSQKYIGRMAYDEIKDIPVGPGGLGRISLLRDILLMMKEEFPSRLINIELKGKLNNFEDDSRTNPSLAEKVMKVIDDVEFPLSKVVFSSFAYSYLQDITELYQAKGCKITVGMLFEPLHECVTGPPKILKDREDANTPLNMETLALTLERLPLLTNVHAEIATITPDTMGFIKAHNLALYTWALRELSPMQDDEDALPFAEAIDRLILMAKDAKMEELTLITDHIHDVKAYLTKMRYI